MKGQKVLNWLKKEIHPLEEVVSARQTVTLATTTTPDRVKAHCTRLTVYIMQQF